MVKKLINWILSHVEIDVQVEIETSDPWGWYYSTRWDCWVHTSELEYAWSNSEGWRGYWVVSEPGMLVWGNELFTETEVKAAQKELRKAQRRTRCAA